MKDQKKELERLSQIIEAIENREQDINKRLKLLKVFPSDNLRKKHSERINILTVSTARLTRLYNQRIQTLTNIE